SPGALGIGVHVEHPPASPATEQDEEAQADHHAATARLLLFDNVTHHLVFVGHCPPPYVALRALPQGLPAHCERAPSKRSHSSMRALTTRPKYSPSIRVSSALCIHE